MTTRNAAARAPTKQAPIRRAVVLGASGFVGQALTIRLKAAGIDVLPLGSAELDLTEPRAGSRLAALLRPDDAVLLLSVRMPRMGRGNSSFLANCSMAHAVAGALAIVPCRHLIYVSSDSVYPFGDAPVSETAPAAPTTLYGAMHLTREIMLHEVASEFFTILRLTQIYGWSDTNNAYGPMRMIRSALNEGRIVLFGQGEERRDHMFVNDAVEVVAKVLERRISGVLNVATGTSVSFAEVARLVASLFPRPITIHSEARAGPITHRRFDTAALHECLPDFAPATLGSGLRRMLAEAAVPLC